MKKIFPLILILLLSLCCVSCGKSNTCIECGEKNDAKNNYCFNCGAELVKDSAESFTKGLTYMELPDGNYAVSAGDALYLDEITIPSSYKGKLVTEIAQNAFCDAPNLKKVILPDTITSINSYAFCRCKQLTSINFPDKLVYIGRNALQGCKLKDIVIPNLVEKIDEHAFLWSYEIESVTILGSGDTVVAYSAFAGCPSLTTVTLGDGVKKIERDAFKGYHIAKVIIGKNVEEIEAGAFGRVAEIWNLSSLQINVGQYGSLAVYSDINTPSRTWITDDNYIFYENGDTCYLLGNIDSCYAWFAEGEQPIINLVLPSNCNGKPYTIKNGAFNTCVIDSIVIPNTISFIEGDAFYDVRIKGNVYFTGTENEWNEITKNGHYGLKKPEFNYQQTTH